MLLYLIRHAEAEDLGTGGITRDFDRPLTARGRSQSRALAAAFGRLGVVVDTVVASPLVRAYQTAKLALDKPKRRSHTRSTSDEILYLDQTVRSLREQLSNYEAAERKWIERWQRIAYHCSRRGLSVEERDGPIDEQHRR